MNEQDQERVEEVREAMAKFLYKTFTVDGAKSMPYWGGIRESLRERLLCDADLILSLKGGDGKPMIGIISDDQSVPESVYSSLIFPTTIEEAGKFLTKKGLTDMEKSAVSGTIARLGWECCIETMTEREDFHRVIIVEAQDDTAK